MKIFILTQPDAFYIPKLMQKFLNEKPEDCVVEGAAVLKGEIAAENIGDYLRLLGLKGFLVNGFEFARYSLLDTIDRFWRLEYVYSVPGVLRKYGIRQFDVSNVNNSSFHQIVKDLDIDLIISIACPQIIKKQLLEIPPKGVINIHGALLPNYRGKLPSFWVLANGEEKTGVTVHYMDEKVDEGPIILQKEVPIEPHDTLHSLVLKSKVGYGAQALAEAVQKIKNEGVDTKENEKEKGTYYSFPDKQAIKRFRHRGRKIR